MACSRVAFFVLNSSPVSRSVDPTVHWSAQTHPAATAVFEPAGWMCMFRCCYSKRAPLGCLSLWVVAVSQPFSGIASPSWPFQGVYPSRPPCSFRRFFFVSLASCRQWAYGCCVQVRSASACGARVDDSSDQGRWMATSPFTEKVDLNNQARGVWNGSWRNTVGLVWTLRSWERGWYFPRLTSFFIFYSLIRQLQLPL